MAQKLLLHACCGPCSAGTLLCLADRNVEPTLYWNNPNIHPYTEYRARLGALKEFAAVRSIPIVQDGDYGVRPFTAAVASDPSSRCAYCYEVRLYAAAQYGAEHGFDVFSTTLLVSPYQDHEAIRRTGEQAALKYGISFLYADSRPFFRQGQEAAREAGLYMQKYCGCIYSEEERYRHKRKRKQRAQIT